MFIIIDPDNFPSTVMDSLSGVEKACGEQAVRKADLIAVQQGQREYLILKNRFDVANQVVDRDRLDDYLQSFTSQLPSRG